MKIARVLTDEEIEAADRKPVAPPKEVKTAKIGDIVSYDNQPKVLNDIYPERKRRVFARVSGKDREGFTRYTRLSYIRQGDWTEFDTSTIEQRLKTGEMELHDKWQLIQLIAQAFADEGDQDSSDALMHVVNERASRL
jgi:hypothetical protein